MGAKSTEHGRGRSSQGYSFNAQAGINGGRLWTWLCGESEGATRAAEHELLGNLALG